MKPKVLFLCTGKSARSQMAEGLLHNIAGDRFEALSAGVEPHPLNPFTVEVMREIGIDISHQHSKDVRESLGTLIPYVISVCDNAKEHCPIFPDAYQNLHWSIEDPAVATGSTEEKLDVFRRVRDELASRVNNFLERHSACRVQKQA